MTKNLNFTIDDEKRHMIIGRSLQRYRKSTGKTGRELAMFLNVSPQQISKYETGADRIKIETLISIAKYFEITSLELFSVILNDLPSEESAINSDLEKMIFLFEKIENKDVKNSLSKMLLELVKNAEDANKPSNK